MTQPEFADLMGVAAITVKKWEYGERRPRPRYARRLKRLMRRLTNPEGELS